MSKPSRFRSSSGLRPWWTEGRPTRPNFHEVDVYVEPDGEGWRVDVIARPTNELLGSDHYPDEDLAAARASDFANLLEQHWFQFGMVVHRQFRRPKGGL
ncbi:MAG TPA: hypothetical protein VGU71_04215 [Candidatus Dormibacteraeota bacterium]|nr:hypothetical protein [Candidatus Dormibacteraeota bacterium]